MFLANDLLCEEKSAVAAQRLLYGFLMNGTTRVIAGTKKN